MNPSIFPPNFPEGIAAVAFVNGDEAAWQQADTLAAISWFAENSYAILGLDLWLPEKDGVRTAISTKAGPAVYASNQDRGAAEVWEDYVQRSAREAERAVVAFRWPQNALEPPRPVFFNLCWSDVESFNAIKKNGKHSADK